MGVAAYNRGTQVNRNAIDRIVSDIRARDDHEAARRIASDIDRLMRGAKEMAERFRYFYSAEWWIDAQRARLKGITYIRMAILLRNRLKRIGYRRLRGKHEQEQAT